MEEPSRGQILNVLKAGNPGHGMWSTPFWTQRNTHESRGRNWPFLLIPRKLQLGKARALLDSEITSQSLHLAKVEKEKKRRERKRSENPSRYTLALPMTLCLTCNQNNSNPVTVCVSAKFLNFSRRQQAPRYEAVFQIPAESAKAPAQRQLVN